MMPDSSGVDGFQKLASLLKTVALESNLVSLYHGACKLEEAVHAARRPFEVAFFGRMKAGKSSLINAFIGRQLAVTGYEETTPTINKLTYGEGAQQEFFTVHWRERIPEAESFPIGQLQSDWNGKAPEVLERIRQASYLELYAPSELLRRVNIIDTPGTGSSAVEHEDMARQFISGQETDALVYVFSSVGRETDEKDLAIFRKACMADSTPYNSVAVLHKWDPIYWENGGKWAEIESKAEFLRHFMSSSVADVVAVSAPLALVSRTASPDFWKKALEFCNSFTDEDDLFFLLDDRHDMEADAACSALYDEAKGYGMPLSSFRVMLRHLYRERPVSEAAAAASIGCLSGIGRLEELLEAQFFRRSTLLQQRKLWVTVSRNLDELQRDISSHLYALAEESRHLASVYEELLPRLGDRHEQCCYLDTRLGKIELARKVLLENSEKIDRLKIEVDDELRFNGLFLDMIPWMDSHSGYFSEEEERLLRPLLGEQTSAALCTRADRGLFFGKLLRSVSNMQRLPDKSSRNIGEELLRYLHVIAGRSFCDGGV